MTNLPPGLTAIGVVRSSRINPADTPVQARLNPDETATLHLEGMYAAGLDGLAEFDFAWLLTWLARPDDPPGGPTR